MAPKSEFFLPVGWKYTSAWKYGPGRNERKCYVFKGPEVTDYRSFATSWTIQSKKDAFKAFWEWYNERQKHV